MNNVNGHVIFVSRDSVRWSNSKIVKQDCCVAYTFRSCAASNANIWNE